MPTNDKATNLTRRYALDNFLREQPEVVAAMLYRLAGLLTAMRLAPGELPEYNTALLAVMCNEDAPALALPDENIIATLMDILPTKDSDDPDGTLITGGAYKAVRESLQEMLVRGGSCRTSSRRSTRKSSTSKKS